MSHARVELIVIAFPQDRLTGRIVPALQDLIDRRLVRAIDLAFVEKDPDGTVRTLSLSSVGDELREAFVPILAESTGGITPPDLAELGEALDPATAAAVLLFEHTWALPFTDAVRESGGQVLFSTQVSADEVDAALDEP
jgi:hypothetical protein